MGYGVWRPESRFRDGCPAQFQEAVVNCLIHGIQLLGKKALAKIGAG